MSETQAQSKKHIVIRNVSYFCENCGGRHVINFPIAPSKMGELLEAFTVLHIDCEQTWTEPVADQSQTVIAKAIYWIANGERGMSAITMWQVFMDADKVGHSHPYDPDDFKRCYKLLEAVPEWKLRIGEMAKVSDQWKNLSENWDKLTEMYETNVKNEWRTYKEVGMYDFMKTLIE